MASIVDDCDNLLPLLLIRISFRWCHGIYENPEPGLFTDVKDAGDKHKVANISTNFRKILNGPNGIPYSLLRGPGKLIYEKNLKAKKNLVSDCL
jgi:hypothetical protein